MSRVKILFIAANPDSETRLALDREYARLDESIKSASMRDRFKLHSSFATTTKSLIAKLMEHKPNIIHFSGHGNCQGICLEDESGNAKLVSTEALTYLFEQINDTVECVILNSCYSESQATAVVSQVRFVVGMNHKISDSAATAFTQGFYLSLSNDASFNFEKAYNIGIAKIKIDGDKDGSKIPVLKKKVV